MSVRETIMAGLVEKFVSFCSNDQSSAGIVTVSRYDENLLMQDSYSTPMVMFIDLGTEERLVVGGGYERFRTTVAVRGYVVGDNADDLHGKLNDILSDIKTFVRTVSTSDISSDLLSVQYVRTEQHRYEKSTLKADCQVIINVTYCEAVTAPTAVAAPAQPFIDTASDLLFARLSGIGATCYQRHDVAKMVLPAISVGFAGLVPTEKGRASSVGVDNSVAFTVRVHTAYGDGFADSANIQTLLNSVVNQIWEKVHLSNAVWLDDISSVQSRILFEESDSIGGEVTVVLRTYVEYTQE